MMVNLPCLMVSLYQLPSSHLFIHRVLAKLSNRIYVLRRVLLQATALVWSLIFTDQFLPARYGFSVDAAPAFSCWSLCWCHGLTTPSLSGFFPEPCPVSESSGTRQGSGIHSLYFMLQSFPASPTVGYPSTSFEDHKRLPWLISQK